MSHRLDLDLSIDWILFFFVFAVDFFVFYATNPTVLPSYASTNGTAE
jgi:hypothetical protein